MRRDLSQNEPRVACAVDGVAAVEAEHRGDYLIAPLVAARALGEFHVAPPELPRIELLTEGEMAVMRLVAKGV